MKMHNGLRKRTYTITTCNLLFQQEVKGLLKRVQESEKIAPGAKILRLSGNETKFAMKEELLPWPKVEDTEEPDDDDLQQMRKQQ